MSEFLSLNPWRPDGRWEEGRRAGPATPQPSYDWKTSCQTATPPATFPQSQLGERDQGCLVDLR